MLLELLPERLPRRGLALVHEGDDRLAELVERHRSDGGVALRDLVAVDPVGDPLLAIPSEREDLLSRDLVDFLLLGRGTYRCRSPQPSEYHPRGLRADDPVVAHDFLLRDLSGRGAGHPPS